MVPWAAKDNLKHNLRYEIMLNLASSLQQAIPCLDGFAPKPARWYKTGKMWFNFDKKIIDLMRGVGHEVELVPSFQYNGFTLEP